MSQIFQKQYATDAVLKDPVKGITLAWSTTVPADTSVGYSPGCIYIDVDAAAGSQLWVNEGTKASSSFKAIASATTSTFTAASITTATITTEAVTTSVITTATITTATITTANITKENLGVGGSTAGAGTNVGTATALPAGTAAIYPTTAADDTVGVVISTSDKVTGRILFIGNGVSNKILKVYGPSGAVINGAAADAAFSSASGKGVIIACLSGSGNTWLAW